MQKRRKIEEKKRVTGACPVTTDFLLRVDVRIRTSSTLVGRVGGTMIVHAWYITTTISGLLYQDIAQVPLGR